ncbi:MAG: ribonuclease E/G [Bacteroidota bacterium]|nr:ribonuclease E/G [Bacteroidota bacterium]MDX5426592.1 ribonuclease E/G [Bacteroidota bacterium]MDX5449085.1 ribonuclease E/G [Bacteroidota bacterium]MDX5504601.1 ribonuclease E/G [Bacteroidota bacterium]
MSFELVINAQSADQVAIALLKNGKLIELLVEKDDDHFSVGDIYLGRVRKLATGLNAAFVEVGYEKDAFLHYHDLGPQIRSSLAYSKRVMSGKQGWALTNFDLHPHIHKDGKIDEVLKPGQQILVQIAKEPISTKGPRITSELSIPGRYLVLVPFSDRVSVSQKIKSREEKDRLRDLVDGIRPKGFGIIVRTVAEGVSVAELEADLRNLVKKWRILFRNLKRRRSPSRVFREMNRASAFLRDVFSDQFAKISVDDNDLCNEIKEFVEEIAPGKEEMVKLFKGKTPIFQYFGIDRQIKSSFGRSVSMAKGSYLIIDHTEAMHVIDVNSGNRTNSGENQEDNALAVNMIAAEEVARQLRLRDMGGIIVVDFIDMHNAENRKVLFQKLKDEMKDDRAKHKILPPSKFGIVEITRQRVRPEMNIPTREENPDNLIEAPILLIDEMEHKLEKLAASGKKKVSLHTHPFLHSYLTKGLLNNIASKWGRKHKVKLKVVPRDAYKMLEFHFFDEAGEELKIK